VIKTNESNNHDHNDDVIKKNENIHSEGMNNINERIDLIRRRMEIICSIVSTWYSKKKEDDREYIDLMKEEEE